MFHSLKRCWLVWALLLCGGQSLFGFAMLGPFNEAWQAPAIGFNVFGDVGGPKNFGQGYRWNTPTNYYAYDQTFLEYFGSNGVAAVDAAFAMYNNLTNASQLDLSAYPLKSSRMNQRAVALGLVDLKSYTMSLLIEQLGLAEPERFTWCLHDRNPIGGLPCPNFDYLIVQRNFDPFSHVYSSFVNGVLYDYQIDEFCGLNPNPNAPVLADAFEIPVDPLNNNAFDAVASGVGSGYSFLAPGTFYLGFTRDDIGGLKYLYSATNAYVESASADSLQLVTNQQVQLLVTLDLGLFYAQALTNNAAALTALYPGLVITATTNFFTNVVTTNVTAFLFNPPFSPAGTVQLGFSNTLTTNVQALFFHTFDNLVIVHSSPLSTVLQQTVTIGPKPFAPAGTLQIVTNTTATTVNATNGDFYILPASQCGPFQILATQLVTQVFTTNFSPIATNGVIITTNSTVPISTSTITSFNQYSLLVHSVDCATNTAGLREGMGDTLRTNFITFVRRDFDSLLGTLWAPITNFYQLTGITNGIPVVQTFRRVVNAPDILITAQDLTAGPAALPVVSYAKRTGPNFNTSQVPNTPPGFGQAIGGPGTIQPFGRVLTFNSVGPIYESLVQFFNVPGFGAQFLQTNSVFLFQWGSFDGRTNDPVVYPSSTSIANLEAQVLFQVITGLLPAASVSGNTVAHPYSFQLQESDTALSSPAATWALDPNSPSLPGGLSLSSAGVISGVPTTVGTFDFTVQATQVNAFGTRVAKKDLFVVINP